MKGYILLIGCFYLSLVSCTKDYSAVDACNNIVQMYQYNPVGSPSLTATITYDASGRVSTVIGELQNASRYTYYKDSIALYATDNYGNNISNDYILDNAGRIVGGDSNYHNTYQYNSAGYMIGYNAYYFNSNTVAYGYIPYTLTYTNGDLTEMSTTNITASPQRVTFTYYNQPNQDLMGYNSPLYLGHIITDRNSLFLIHNGYFGKQSQHLLDSITFYDQSNTPTPGQDTYEYDSTGRITSLNGGVLSFIYQCH